MRRVLPFARLARFATFAVSLFTWLAAEPLRADVALPAVFSDGMVLQRDIPVPVWGTAVAGEKVTVRFRDQSHETLAAADGTWRVQLTPLQAGGPDEFVVAGKNTLTRTGVLVGEVWVGSGQSNMAGALNSYLDTDPELRTLRDAGPYANIRVLKGNGTWQPAAGNNLGTFSALLFPFGEKIHRELDVPVGLMLGAVGGTPSGAWITKQALDDDAASQALIAEYAKGYDDAVARFEKGTLPAWLAAAEKLKAAGKPVGRQLSPPAKPGMLGGNREVGYLFEQHVRPFVGYAIRGVLWDQGESGTGLGGVDQYTLMGALIRSWRSDWKQGDFPFLYVQKPSGGGCAWDVSDPVTSRGQTFSKLPEVVPPTLDGRYVETHIRIMSYPNVGMVISSDLGPGTHPQNKSGYGRRAAAVALGMVYQKPVAYYGPIYASHAVEGKQVRVKFSHVGQGLAAAHSEQLQGFAVAGADKVWHWADAKIDGDDVVVGSPEVAEPVAVRYAWGSIRTWANLFNRDGLPAVTFRTDDWER